MDQILDDLSSARGYVRERALSSIVECLNASYRFEFAEESFATLLYGCLRSLKRGNSEEMTLASRALGLLSITIGFGDNADELHKESLPLIKESLRSRNEPSLIPVINCLAVSTFVRANFFETIVAMDKIWEVIISNPDASIPQVRSAAISAWSFLLSSVNVSLRPNFKDKIHFFRGLLDEKDQIDEEDQSICMAAAVDALALFLETNFFKDGMMHEILSIGKHSLELNSLSKLLQVEFIMNFLGPGFLPHMLENEFLHAVLNFTPEEQTLEEDEEDKVVVRVYMPERMKSHAAARLAIIKKGRTLLLKKKRMLKSQSGAGLWTNDDSD